MIALHARAIVATHLYVSRKNGKHFATCEGDSPFNFLLFVFWSTGFGFGTRVCIKVKVKVKEVSRYPFNLQSNKL